MKYSNSLLVIAGLMSFGAAIFQVAIGIIPEWSDYWGAGDELASNPTLLLVSSLMVGVAAAVAGLYALSGAGLIRRLPLLRTGLIVIGAICTLRGIALLSLLLTVLGILPSQGPIPDSAWLSSLIFLLIGLAYLLGVVFSWQFLSPQATKAGRLKTSN